MASPIGAGQEGGSVRTNIHKTMGISFEAHRRALGDPDFLSAEEVADVVLFCWKQPPRICIREIVVTPTRFWWIVLSEVF